MVPTVSFVGNSSSGKTTLLERVIGELKMRGYRVCVVKHTHHDFDIDRPGKDSWRFARAGSDIVAVSSPHRLAIVEQVDAEPGPAQLEALLEGRCDIIITEGYKNGDAPKVLVLGADGRAPRFAGELLATVSARLSALGIPEFDDEDVARIISLLVRQITLNTASKPDRSRAPVSRSSGRRTSELEELLDEPLEVSGHTSARQALGALPWV